MTKKDKSIMNKAKGGSLFESAIRKLPLNRLPHFESGMIQFEAASSNEELAEVSDSLSAQLPALCAKQANHLLQGALISETPDQPKRIALLFSGGPASGGHNVVVGVHEVLGGKHTLLGVKAGPKGLLKGDLVEITEEDVAHIRNTGGFDFLGSDRTKIKTDAQFEKVRTVVKQHELDGIIIVGGDDSNTNAAFLADRLADLNCAVVGAPKTIDGDLQVGHLLPISFGFHTATRIYAEMVGNILQDTPSSRKYWHFVKLMGRSASHVTLEVALQTQAHFALISEEVKTKKIKLNQLMKSIAEVIVNRAQKGQYYGVGLIPEGLIEFVPDLVDLIGSLNTIMADPSVQNEQNENRVNRVIDQLSETNREVFNQLSRSIQETLCKDRDSHGNLQVSLIPTETLLMDLVPKHVADITQARLNQMDLPKNEHEALENFQLKMLGHFFGYEGRCGAPSLFDAFYTYNLGIAAGSLALQGFSGYMASVTDLDQGGRPLGIPLVRLIEPEIRHGKTAYVIRKALVDLDSPAFKAFAQHRDQWGRSDCFTSPGPRQLWGPTARELPLTVILNQGYSSPYLPE